MKIIVVGTGYVGLVAGACFAEMGNNVTCVDIDRDKIEGLKKGVIPIYEPGLELMVLRGIKNNTLRFNTKLNEVINDSDIIFIAVGTPMGEDGSADLQYLLAVAKEIGKSVNKNIIVVNKSTVPIGSADKVKAVITEELNKRNISIKFSVVSNPEFLKEGVAINDFMKPDRVVVGTDNDETLEVMRELYAPFTRNHDRFISMDIRSAEMTKYAANAMLATKISFMNEIANICERVGADVNKVRIGIGSDSRIGYSFIYPGIGYGGSCFPKDTQALIKIAKDVGFEPKIINAVEARNKSQKEVIANKVIKRFMTDKNRNNLNGLTFAIWGLSFKPETDDMREAPSVVIINKLTSLGAKVKAYDPKAVKEAKEFYLKDNENVEYFDSKYDVLNDSSALLLLTEWKEFRSPDFEEIKKRLKNNIIFDGRNQYNIKKLQKLGFEYYQIGV